VEAILKLSPPKTKFQLGHFLGMINYYRDMWQNRSHILAPLTGLVSPLVKYKWGEEQQKGFDEIKQKVSNNVVVCSENDTWECTGKVKFRVHLTALGKMILGEVEHGGPVGSPEPWVAGLVSVDVSAFSQSVSGGSLLRCMLYCPFLLLPLFQRYLHSRYRYRSLGLYRHQLRYEGHHWCPPLFLSPHSRDQCFIADYFSPVLF
jgi:hypothetical protein